MRWNVAGRMATAWVFTMPSAGVVGAVSFAVADGIGGNAGIILILAGVVALATTLYLLSRRTAVTPDNVNATWTGRLAPASA